MRHKLLDIAEQSSLREEPLNFTVGDTVGRSHSNS